MDDRRSLLRDLLRDRWITGCATLMILATIAAYVVLVSTSHSDEADRAIWRIWQAVMFLSSVAGVGGRVVRVAQHVESVDGKVTSVDEKVNGHLAELTARIPTAEGETP